jgi:type III restriction enzyme
MGILPEKYDKKDLFIKDSFKETEFWQKGKVFINGREPNPRTEIFSLQNARIKNTYQYNLKTGELKEEAILDEKETPKTSTITKVKIKYNLKDFGENVIRFALDKLDFYRFDNLKRYFPNLNSIREFVVLDNYLGGVEVEVSGVKERVEKLSPTEKLEITLFVTAQIAEQAKVNTSEYIGTRLFRASSLQSIFRDKILKIESDAERAEGMKEINLAEKDWYAQNELYGTSEERDFITFIDSFIGKLKPKYSHIALLRNEKFFQIYDFEQGRPFEPDFVMLLEKKNGEVITYQIFIEAKGDQFKDSSESFENSKEGWKQKFLLEIESEAQIDMSLNFENKHFKLIGLPFYNKALEKEFKEALEEKLLR